MGINLCGKKYFSPVMKIFDANFGPGFWVLRYLPRNIFRNYFFEKVFLKMIAKNFKNSVGKKSAGKFKYIPL